MRRNSTRWLLGAILTVWTGACGGGEEPQGATGTGAPGLSCPAGFDDCDGEMENGCEAALRTSLAHCGACGAECHAPDGADASCQAGTCSFVCTAGRADCDGEAKNGCEVDLFDDAANCGACGVACAATCDGGTCDVSVLASAQRGPMAIATDGEGVFWLNRGNPEVAEGSIVRWDKGDETTVTLASELLFPLGMALDDAHVYWTTYAGSILRVAKEGGAVTELASGQALPTAIAVDAGVAYWTNAGTPPMFEDGVVMALDLAAPGAPFVLATISGGLFSVAASSGVVFTTTFGATENDGAVHAIDVARGGAPRVLAEGLAPVLAIAVGELDLFCAVGDDIARIPKDGSSPPIMLVSGPSAQPATLALGGGFLYWIDNGTSDGRIYRARTDGSERTLVARNLSSPWGLALDEGFVYWSEAVAASGEEGTGAVSRAPR
jgi:hypothetical protein